MPDDFRTLYDRCIRCGLCLNACPTYRVLGEELDSPRGRIYQVAQADQGRLKLDDDFRLHMDRCLDCRACMTACPSGVNYGAIIEGTRATLRAQRPLRFWQHWLLEDLVPHPRRRRVAARLIHFAQAAGLARFGPPSARLCPPLTHAPFRAAGATFPAEGERRARVVFLPGCVQCEMLPELNRATVRVLTRQGVEVIVPPSFGCCGALHVHAGEPGFARQLARANIASLEAMDADAVVTNASGCGAQLKQYADLFADEEAQRGDGATGPRPSASISGTRGSVALGPASSNDEAWLPRAAAFSARVRDANEFLDALGLRRELLGPIPAVATYQDACHLAHAQRIREAPRSLLRQIPGLELREMERADQCCGSAGIYNLQQPALAAQLAADRVAAFRATGATILATANPGCSLQLAAALPPPVTVAHVLELLDQSHRAAL